MMMIRTSATTATATMRRIRSCWLSSGPRPPLPALRRAAGREEPEAEAERLDELPRLGGGVRAARVGGSSSSKNDTGDQSPCGRTSDRQYGDRCHVHDSLHEREFLLGK